MTPSRLPLECKYGPLRLWSCEGKDDISIMLSQHSGLGRAAAPLHPGPNPPPPPLSSSFPPSIGHLAACRCSSLFYFEDFIRISMLQRWIHHASVICRCAAPPLPPPRRCCYRLSICGPSIKRMKPGDGGGSCGCECEGPEWSRLQEVSVTAPPSTSPARLIARTHTLLCTQRT